MKDGTGPRPPAGVRWAYRIVNSIFVGGTLGTIIVWNMVGLGSSHEDTASYAVAMLLTYSLIVAAFLVLVLVVHAVAARTISLLKWPFVLFALMHLVVLCASDVLTGRLSGSDTVQLQLVNKSGELIQWVDIFGRGEETRIEGIAADSGVAVSYRGRKNNYRTRNSYSNRISVSWVVADRRRERVLVRDAVVIGDSLFIVFTASDSVLVSERREDVIRK